MVSTKTWAVAAALCFQACGGCATSPIRTIVSMDNNGPGEVHLWVEGEEGTFAPNQLPLERRARGLEQLLQHRGRSLDSEVRRH